ncbi:MAG: DUF5687 family protein [Phocaeicola sp.]
MNLLSILRKNRNLEAKRNPAFDRNRFAKVLIYFMVAFWAAYLIFFGVMLPFAFENIFPGMEPYHILNKGILFIFLTDFLLRFIAQQPPAQEIKPYLLMPVSRKKLLNAYLVQTALNPYNLFWFFLLLPFAAITIWKFYGLLGMGTYLLAIWVLMLFNNFWQLICRTLLQEKTIYLLLPVTVYGALALIEFIPNKGYLSNLCMNVGEAFIESSPLALMGAAVATLIAALLYRKLQLKLLYSELARTTDSKSENNYKFSFLERYGEIGEYMRLEIKLCLRNKIVRNQVRMGLLVMLMFSALLAFTDVYDGTQMIRFICIYNYAVLGIMTLSQLLCFEGNYLDGLMSRKESIYTLLRAKYYIHITVLLIPFLFTFIPIYKGKITLLMTTSYLFFTAGFVFLLLFQLAVYNQKSIPLNSPMMQGNKGGSLFQGLVTSACFGLPLLINSLLFQLFSEEVSLLIMMGIGAALVALHPLWIKNIYNRFMKRRYQNMESFRNTR